METDQKTTLEPIPIVVTRHVCPFCHRSRSRIKPAKLHMERCWKNPALEGCKTCTFFNGKDRCNAGFNLERGLVTECVKWKERT